MKKLLNLMAILLMAVVACEKTPMPQAPETAPETEQNSQDVVIPELAGKWQVLKVKEEYFAPKGDDWVLEDDAMSDYEKMSIDVWAHFLPGDRMVWEVDDELMREKIRVYDYKTVQRAGREAGNAGAAGAAKTYIVRSIGLGNVEMEILEIGGGRMVIQTTEVQEHSSMGPQKIVQRVECKRATGADLPDIGRDLAGDWTQHFTVVNTGVVSSDENAPIKVQKEIKDNDMKNLRTYEDGTLIYFSDNFNMHYLDLYDEMHKVADNQWSYHTSWKGRDGAEYHDYFTLHMLAKDEVLVLFHHVKPDASGIDHAEEAIVYRRHDLDAKFKNLLEQANVIPTCMMKLQVTNTKTYECNGDYWKLVKEEKTEGGVKDESGYEVEYNLSANKRGCEMLVENNGNWATKTLQQRYFRWELERTTFHTTGWGNSVKDFKMSHAAQKDDFDGRSNGMMHVLESREEVNGKMVVTERVYQSFDMTANPNQTSIIQDKDLIKKNLTEPKYWYTAEEVQAGLDARYFVKYYEGSNTKGVIQYIVQDSDGQGYQETVQFEIGGDKLKLSAYDGAESFSRIGLFLHDKMEIYDEYDEKITFLASYPAPQR